MIFFKTCERTSERERENACDGAQIGNVACIRNWSAFHCTHFFGVFIIVCARCSRTRPYESRSRIEVMSLCWTTQRTKHHSRILLFSSICICKRKKNNNFSFVYKHQTNMVISCVQTLHKYQNATPNVLYVCVLNFTEKKTNESILYAVSYGAFFSSRVSMWCTQKRRKVHYFDARMKRRRDCAIH